MTATEQLLSKYSGFVANAVPLQLSRLSVDTSAVVAATVAS